MRLELATPIDNTAVLRRANFVLRQPSRRWWRVPTQNQPDVLFEQQVECAREVVPQRCLIQAICEWLVEILRKQPRHRSNSERTRSRIRQDDRMTAERRWSTKQVVITFSSTFTRVPKSLNVFRSSRRQLSDDFRERRSSQQRVARRSCEPRREVIEDFGRHVHPPSRKQVRLGTHITKRCVRNQTFLKRRWQAVKPAARQQQLPVITS